MKLTDLQERIGKTSAYAAIILARKYDIGDLDLSSDDRMQVYKSSPSGSSLESKALENMGKLIE